MALLTQVLAVIGNLHGPFPYVLIFGVLLMCGFGLPLPEDILLFAGGMLAYYGQADIYLMTIVAFFGIMIGDATIFFLGNRFGPTLLSHRVFQKIMHAERLAYVKESFHAHGNKVIFGARFMPGLRTPVFFTAGTLHLPFRVFLFYDGMAALISVPAITFAVYYFGGQVEKVVHTIRNIEHGIILVIAAVALFVGVKVWLGRRSARKAALVPESRIESRAESAMGK